MVPASFVFLDALPLLPNGKVNRQALPGPDQAGSEVDREYTSPRTPREEKLAGIIAAVLQVERVGIHDNFFERGGHSLLGMQVIARIRREFRVELPLRTLFEEPTVAGLCMEIEAAGKRDAGTLPPPPSRRVSRKEQLLARLSGLSEEEVDSLLSGLLATERDE
jgi:acyl carrier protein